MDESSSIQIPFPFEPGVDYDAYDRYPFWNLPSTIEWFRKRGYTVYESIDEGLTKPALPYAVDSEAKYPYAYCDTEIDSRCPEMAQAPLVVQEKTGKIVYAQDSCGRHVVIKLVIANTDEYRVLKFLSEQPLETLQENCVIPVLELLPNDKYWFAVMPRWGDYVYYPSLTRLYEAIDIIHGLLKGLVFLHESNICHGDISLNNVLVNHFSNMTTLVTSNKTRNDLRLGRRLSYALFDFDFSIMLPADANRNGYRLPYERSWGTFNLTEDTGAGEFDYDPFAFDVGGLGVTLCDEYQGLTGIFPALAPLFDMMSTWDVRRRFTATQALEFFETNVSELTDAQLHADISGCERPFMDYNEYDRWQHLSVDLVEKWKMYRETPEPWTRRLLRAICKRDGWRHIVPWTRWFCFQVFSEIPFRCYKWLFPSKIQL